MNTEYTLLSDLRYRSLRYDTIFRRTRVDISRYKIRLYTQKYTGFHKRKKSRNIIIKLRKLGQTKCINVPDACIPGILVISYNLGCVLVESSGVSVNSSHDSIIAVASCQREKDDMIDGTTDGKVRRRNNKCKSPTLSVMGN